MWLKIIRLVPWIIRLKPLIYLQGVILEDTILGSFSWAILAILTWPYRRALCTGMNSKIGCPKQECLALSFAFSGNDLALKKTLGKLAGVDSGW